jgi:S1-C subfamily serine protease
MKSPFLAPGPSSTRIPLRILTLATLFTLVAVLAGAAGKKEASPTGPVDSRGDLVASAGVLVTGVEASSPAAKAGIARGDIVTEADGKAVNTPRELQAAITAKKSGDTLTLKLRHGDADKTVTATLGSQGGRTWLGIEAGAGLGMGVLPGTGREFGFGFGFDNGRDGLAAKGAYVASVVAGGPAEKAGLVQGDMILSVDGTAVDATHTLGDLVGAKKPGDTVTLSVQSNDQQSPRDVKVTLDKNPDTGSARLGVQYAVAGQRGSGAGPAPQGNGRGLSVAGVIVAEVESGSPAAKAGIKARDVITKVDGTAVTDAQQVVDAVAKHKVGDSVAVTVTRAADGSSADVTVALAANPSDATKAWMGVSLGGRFQQRQQLLPAPRRDGTSALPGGGGSPDADAQDGTSGASPMASSSTLDSPTM